MAKGGPAPFSEIGKRARDLLTKDYNFDHKCVLTMSGDAGLGVTATGVKMNQLFIGDISTQYKMRHTSVDVKVDSNSNISSTVTAYNDVSGVKAAFSFKIPDHKSGKLDMQYLRNRAAINSSIGLTPTPLLEFAATTGSKELNIGAEIGFDTSSASFTKYNAGIGYTKEDFSASLILADKGETLKASYIHVVDPVKGTSVAAEMINRLNTYENTFTVGSSHALTPFTAVKTRFTNNGKLAVVCSQEWRPNSRLTISAEYDPKSVGAPSRVGVALSLKP
uniref:Mitochondrial outer membrane protein porin 6 n=1 Tax=Anthurium amnicola TaxID=1678845 RepID=A0A1D1YL14_9ARAE